MLHRAAKMVSKDWVPIRATCFEETVQCRCSKYKLTYWHKKGTLRLTPPKGAQQKYLYGINKEMALIDVMLDLETAYDKATAGERKTTVAVVKTQKTTTTEEMAIMNKLYGQNTNNNDHEKNH